MLDFKLYQHLSSNFIKKCLFKTINYHDYYIVYIKNILVHLDIDINVCHMY